MLRGTAAATLFFLASSLGCATVDPTQGTYFGADAGSDAAAPVDDLVPADAAPDDVASADQPDVVDVVDVASDRGTDVGFDVPAAPLDAGPCTEGMTRACYTGVPMTRGVGLCADGFQRCVAGRYGVECNGETRPQVEVCNLIDDDCDGVVDNIPTTACYTGPPGTAGVGICHPGLMQCEGAMAPRCTGQVVPETREVCGNMRDDNCNGMTDEAGCT